MKRKYEPADKSSTIPVLGLMAGWSELGSQKPLVFRHFIAVRQLVLPELRRASAPAPSVFCWNWESDHSR